MIMHRRTAFLAVLTIIIIGLLISCTLVGFVQAKKVDSPAAGTDVNAPVRVLGVNLKITRTLA